MPEPFQMSVQEILTQATVLIECEYADGTTGSGTGFYFSFFKHGNLQYPVVVTNKHVIENSQRGRIRCTLTADVGGPWIGHWGTLEFLNFVQHWIMHPDPAVDLCVLPIAYQAGLLLEKGGRELFYCEFDQESLLSDAARLALEPIEQVLMVGYPRGLWDHVNNLPLVRSGITATHPGRAFQGKQHFVVDAACFPGSSGSPVVLFNPNGWLSRGLLFRGIRMKLLGILYAGPQYTAEGSLDVVNIPTSEKVVAMTSIPMHLGYAINSNRILDFEPILRRCLEESGQDLSYLSQLP